MNGLNLETKLAGVKMKNPVITASGTFGSGREFSDFIDLNILGAVTVKGVSSTPWIGNNSPRIAETNGGMLNSIGLQNNGIDFFIKNDIPFLRKYNTKIIVNICGHTITEYCSVAEKLANRDVDLLELNISCPNLTAGGMEFGTDPTLVQKIICEVKKHSKQPLIVKLSPNVTDIVEIAKAAEYSGANALSLINTLQGMKIDIYSRKAILANKIGGYSGPGIKPVAVRMVYQVCKAVNIPVIGMGGISNAEDAIEFIMAGAEAIAIGTANFNNPFATSEVIDGIKNFMAANSISDISQIRGIID